MLYITHPSRRVRAHQPSLIELLEGRILLSSFTEVEPNNTFAFYQPLNNDTSYSGSGSISALSDVDYYAFYVSKGSTISLNCKAAITTGDEHTEFDPTIGLFNPSGGLIKSDDDNGLGSIWAAALSFSADKSGVWRVAVSHYSDFSFNGGNTRPSYDPNNPNSTGPGVHTGSYVLSISGTQKPEIKVIDTANPTEVDATNPTMFKIDANADMPQIPLRVVGIAPDPNTPISYVWNKTIQLATTDSPLGKGAYAKTVFNPETITVTSNYTPKFQGMTRGGNLTLSVKTTVAGLTLEAKRDDTNPFKITGTNPSTSAVVVAYISGLGSPSLMSGSTYNFGRIIQAIIKHESGGNTSLVNQFLANGFPNFSTSGDGGAGLMQLSLLNVSQENRWNWKRNISDGFNLLAGNLEQSNRHFRNDRNAVSPQQLAILAQANGVSSVAFAIPSVDDLLFNALSLYGPNSRYYHSYKISGAYVVTRNPNGTGTINLNVDSNIYVTTILGRY